MEALLSELEQRFLVGPNAPPDAEELFLQSVLNRVWVAARSYFESLPVLAAALEGPLPPR